MKLKVSIVSNLAAFAMASLLPSNLHAAQITWEGNTSGNLTLGSNWIGGTAPAGNTDSALFLAAGAAGTSLINPASGNNTQYVGNFTNSIGALQFNSSASSYTFSGSDIRIGDGGIWNAAGGSVQTFNNVIRLNTTNSFTIAANYAATILNGNLDLSQGVGTRTVTIAFGATTGGRVEFNGNIVNSNGTPGTGSLTTSATAGSGAGTVILSGSNSSLNGTVTVGAGTTVKVTGSNSLGSAAVALPIASQYGTLQIARDTGTTYANSITAAASTSGIANIVSDRATAGAGVSHGLTLASGTLGSSGAHLLVQAGENVTSGTAGINFTTSILGATGATSSTVFNPIGTSVGLTTLAAAVPTGTASNSAATFHLAGSGTGLAGSSAGSGSVSGAISNSAVNGSGFYNIVSITKSGPSTWTLSGTNTYNGSTTLNGGKLVLDYATNDTNKISSAGALTLTSGTLELSGGSFAQSVASTTINTGGSQITRASGTATIALGAITQTAGALNISGNNVATTSTANTNGRLGGFSRITVGSGTSYSFAKNDGSNNIVGMADSDYTALAATSGNNALVYNLDGSLAYTGPNTTIGSLRIRPTGAGQSLTINGTNAPAIGNSTTGAGAGAILFAGSDDYSIVNNSTGNALRASTGSLLIHQWGTGNLTITGTGNATGVILSSQIDKFGSGRLIISGNNSNTSTTAATIGGGILQVASNAALGNQTTGGAISLQGGTFVADTAGGSFALNNNNSGNNNRNVTVGLSGGGIDVIGGNSLTISGVISGSTVGTGSSFSAPLTLGSSTSNGTIILSGANTYTGGTILAGGTTQLNVAEVAGTSGPLGRYSNTTGGAQYNYITFAGGTLQFTSTNTNDYSNRFAQVANQQFKINTNGQNVSFATGLAGAASTLTKLGTGTLTLNGRNTYMGATTVSQGTLALSGTGSLASTSLVIGSTSGTKFDVTGLTAGSVSLGSAITFNLGATSVASALYDATGKAFAYNGQNITFAFASALAQGSYSYNLFDFASQSGQLGTVTFSGGYTGSTDWATLTGAGYTIGDATFTFDQTQGLLSVVAVPEPSAYALAVLGLLGLIVVARRRRSRA